jgi:hypothetical protein
MSCITKLIKCYEYSWTCDLFRRFFILLRSCIHPHMIVINYTISCISHIPIPINLSDDSMFRLGMSFIVSGYVRFRVLC